MAAARPTPESPPVISGLRPRSFIGDTLAMRRPSEIRNLPRCAVSAGLHSQERLWLLHLDFDKGNGMRRGVRYIVTDAGRTQVGLTGRERHVLLALAVADPQRPGHEHRDEIRPRMFMPARGGPGGEVPAGDPQDGIIL